MDERIQKYEEKSALYSRNLQRNAVRNWLKMSRKKAKQPK